MRQRPCALGHLLLPLILYSAPLWAQPRWEPRGVIAEGTQLDAARGPDETVHLIAARYAQLDYDGVKIVDEDVGDPHQGHLDMPPALAVGADGSVHVVTRHAGDWSSGQDIRYRMRAPGGGWSRDYLFGERAKRNYVVGVAWTPSGVFLSHSHAGDDVWGDLRIFRAGEGSAAELGRVSGVWRSDADARMRGGGDRVFMVSGKCDPAGIAFMMSAPARDSLPGDLYQNRSEHTAGESRKGFPDLYVDGQGRAHFVYGARHTLYYNRFSAGGQRELEDRAVASNLGDWHISAGLGAVAASDDGEAVVIVALRSDGSHTAADSTLLWAYSLDGGQSFSAAAEIGPHTHGGEGRARPRLVAVHRRFFLLYNDTAARGVSLALLDLPVDRDGDGFYAHEDCDDGNRDINPGAEELCDGVDNNCANGVDEGCPEDRDGDGFDETEDCDDGNRDINPGAEELCDGVDNNCAGGVDEGCLEPDASTPRLDAALIMDAASWPDSGGRADAAPPSDAQRDEDAGEGDAEPDEDAEVDEDAEDAYAEDLGAGEAEVEVRRGNLVGGCGVGGAPAAPGLALIAALALLARRRRA